MVVISIGNGGFIPPNYLCKTTVSLKMLPGKDQADIGEGVDGFRPKAGIYSFTIKIYHWPLTNPRLGFKSHFTHDLV
jgi:hypothetical protein